MDFKVQVAYRIDETTYNRLAVISNRKGLTVPQLTRLIVKQYLENNTNGTQKTNTDKGR
jgi:antitoxin component of RelBE/YafQ-DinJ toxin-antitoxin module